MWWLVLLEGWGEGVQNGVAVKRRKAGERRKVMLRIGGGKCGWVHGGHESGGIVGGFEGAEEKVLYRKEL